MSEDDELLVAFLEESRENLDQLDLDLVALEDRPRDPELLARVFRTIHTIKGTCGFLGYERLEALTHAGEHLLGQLRAGEVGFDATTATTLLQLVDAVRAVLGRLAANGDEGDDDHRAVIEALATHLAPARPAAATAPAPPPTPASDPGPPGAQGVGASPETSVRVDVAVLDHLQDLVGELVLARSQLGEALTGAADGPLAQPLRQLHLVTGELQLGVMQVRLQPVSTVVGKCRRLARDVATSLGKRVRVDIEGDDVSVDRAVNEALRDPLVHLVRNAVDHGIEAPHERVAAGKPAEAVLRIRASHEAGRVVIEVADDGRGIDGARLAARLVATGALSAADAERLSPTERLELVFRRGLSTKDEVTTVSGRGVGMDVVRANLDHIGGTIDVWSEAGVGSAFRIGVPLTVAIVPAVIVRCRGERYAVPQSGVEEVLHLDAEAVHRTVDVIGGALVHHLRGHLLPLVDLGHQLGLAAQGATDGIDVVVVRDDDRRFGLVVDAIGDPVEAVVKSLPRAVRSVPVFGGVTILSDGRPALILDVAGLAAAAGVERTDPERRDTQEAVVDLAAAGTLLLATGTDGGRLAFPLDAVHRLERFAPSAVERAGPDEVVSYGDGILPLVHVTEHLGGEAPRPATTAGPDGDDRLATVVCRSSAGLVGMVVGGIDDVAPEPDAGDQPAPRRGVRARLVVADHVVELVDVDALVEHAGLRRSS